MSGPSSRLLRLLSLLQTRRDWSGHELAERLEVSPRTVRRDVDRLRMLGYPVDALPGPAGGYRMQAGTAMPPLVLEDDEAVAIAVGLRTATGASVTGMDETAVRALVKLEQVLPAHLRRRVNALQSVTAVPAPSGPMVDPQALTTIAGACRDAEQLRFTYHDRSGRQTRRLVEPHSLVNVGRRWYVVAWCCERQAWRSFRLDRLEKPFPAGRRFTQRELPDGLDPAAFVSSTLSEAVYRYQARVTLHAPAAELRRRHPHLARSLTPLGEERCEYRTSDDHLDWLAMRIGMLGVPFEVHEPPELAERFRALADRFSAAAG